ncbi:MAG: Uncharacterised protein [Owenweeksia sp. TMED14]|nr:MAG: Uncharacterised protein [Owenweeksia sp. TMED14]|tara:strand:- start:1135 stop:1674 length:540 start_codon:yes stop_codon:yes gene_type:complete
MEHLESQNIILRSLEPSDINSLLRWENNPENWIIGTRTIPYSKHELTRYIEESGSDFWDTNQTRFAITLKTSDSVVGVIDVFNANSLHLRAEVGILIDPAYRRKGFAVESLNIIQKWCHEWAMIRSLMVYIYSDHVASKNTFLSAGFQRVGELKSWIRTSAGWKDVDIFQWYSIEKNEE